MPLFSRGLLEEWQSDHKACVYQKMRELAKGKLKRNIIQIYNNWKASFVKSRSYNKTKQLCVLDLRGELKKGVK